ncbi:MAG: TIGR00282 family metallophosphoesterase [Spirochaetia bacterium]|nr:TIGR00282 family metallophosphoesterase [Spirochaetia bacterium]
MPADTINILFLGDIIGQPGNRAVFFNLKSLIKKYNADFTVVNGENSAEGFGILPAAAEQMFQGGADVITTGNHVWQKNEIYPYLDEKEAILRPANFPAGVPGHGSCIVEKHGVKLAVMNLQGRENMSTIECPFRCGRELAKKLRKETPLILVDFHAESSSEKEALGCWLDGQVSALVGTHTHVQTADERILKGGTAYITDVGMTGPEDSVIGTIKEISIERSLTQMPLKMEIADLPVTFCGVLIKVDAQSGKALSIERLAVPV